MKGIADILIYLLNLIDNDKKRLLICESPKNIFLLGFYYSKIEKSIMNSKINEKLNIDEFSDLIENEDYYKIFTYIEKVNMYYDNMMSKYSF